MNEALSIESTVQGSPKFQSLLEAFKASRYLIELPFEKSFALIINDELVAQAWEQQPSRQNAIAYGMLLYNHFFSELVASALRGEDPCL